MSEKKKRDVCAVHVACTTATATTNPFGTYKLQRHCPGTQEKSTTTMTKILYPTYNRTTKTGTEQ